MVSVFSIVAGGFRLVKSQPIAVAVWGLVYVALTIGSAYAMAPISAVPAAGVAENAPPEIANLAWSLSLMLLVQLATLIVVTVLFTAAMRAVLHPHAEGGFFLRVGLDELRIIGLVLFFGIAFYFLLTVVVMILVVAGMLAGGAETGTAFYAVIGSGGLVALALSAWVSVRLSLCYPLTLMHGRIMVGPAWRATRGHFWPIFGACLILFLLMVLLWIAVLMATNGEYLAGLLSSGFVQSPADQQAQLARQLDYTSPRTLLGWLAGGLVGAIGIALFGGAFATAARALAGTPEDELVRTFD